MKTQGWQHFSKERLKASLRRNRAAMRAYAMDFRQQIAPDNAIFGKHSERIEHAGRYLGHAIFYRDMARRDVERLEAGA